MQNPGKQVKGWPSIIDNTPEISLRNWFAGMAMQTLCKDMKKYQFNWVEGDYYEYNMPDVQLEKLTEESYKIADTFIKFLEKGK